MKQFSRRYQVFDASLRFFMCNSFKFVAHLRGNLHEALSSETLTEHAINVFVTAIISESRILFS